MRFYHWFWWHIYLLLLLLLLAIILFWFLFWLDYMRAYSSSQNSIVLVTRLRYYSGWFSHWIALLCFLTCTQNERNETRMKQVAKAYTTWLSSSCRTALYHDVARLLLLVCRLIACRFTLMWFNRLGLVFSSENVLAIAYLIKRNFKWNNAQQVMLFTFFSLQLSQLTEYQITQTPSPQFGLTPTLSLSLSFVLSFILSFFCVVFPLLSVSSLIRSLCDYGNFAIFVLATNPFHEAHQSNQVHYICQLWEMRPFSIHNQTISVSYSCYQHNI